MTKLKIRNEINNLKKEVEKILEMPLFKGLEYKEIITLANKVVVDYVVESGNYRQEIIEALYTGFYGYEQPTKEDISNETYAYAEIFRNQPMQNLNIKQEIN